MIAIIIIIVKMTLQTNYNYHSTQVQNISYDYVDENVDPTAGNSHGTNCGGIAGASRNDGTCGVGVAYDSNLGGRCLILQIIMKRALLLSHNIAKLQ